MSEGIGKKYTAENLELLHQGFTRLLDSLISFARNNPSAKTRDIVYKLGITVSLYDLYTIKLFYLLH